MTYSDNDKNQHFDESWKPIWTIPGAKARKKAAIKKRRQQTTHDFQENKAPTCHIEKKVPNNKNKTTQHRRLLDARLWDALSAEQQDAAFFIDHAYQLITRGLGYRISKYSPITGHATKEMAHEKDADRMNFYFKWAETCNKRKYTHAACLDVLVFGKTCRKIDRERRMRNGWAKQNLHDCLTLYAELRGWSL